MAYTSGDVLALARFRLDAPAGEVTPMPAPASANELLDLVQKSGVTDGGKLQAYVSKLASASGTPTEPTKMADRKSTRLNSSHLRLSRMPSSA